MGRISISAGITQFKKEAILQALVHNHRVEAKQHKNIMNNNTNYYMKKDGEIGPVPEWDKRGKRKELRDKGHRLWKTHFNRQKKLLQRRAKERGVNPPKDKDIKPLQEGIVNFGNVYDIRMDDNETRLAKTQAFHEKYDEETWTFIMEQVRINLIKWCKENGVELLDLVFHRDEEGLYHFHFITTNYNPETGQGLGVRNNKDGVGDRLQDLIAEGMEKYDLHRAEGKRKGMKKMTKEELQRMRAESEEYRTAKQEMRTEIKELRKEVADLKEDKEFLDGAIKDGLNKVKELEEVLMHYITELSTPEFKDTYQTKGKLEKILKTAKYALGRGNMAQYEKQVEKFGKVVEAFKKAQAEGKNGKTVFNTSTKPPQE